MLLGSAGLCSRVHYFVGFQGPGAGQGIECIVSQPFTVCVAKALGLRETGLASVTPNTEARVPGNSANLHAAVPTCMQQCQLACSSANLHAAVPTYMQQCESVRGGQVKFMMDHGLHMARNRSSMSIFATSCLCTADTPSGICAATIQL